MRVGNSSPRKLGNFSPLSWLIDIITPFCLYEGEGGAGGAGGEGAGGSGGAGGAGTGHFSEGFSEEVKAHPSIGKFKSSEEMASSYINLEKKIGMKGVIVPNEHSKPEDIENFHKGIGRPETPDLYEIVKPIAEGQEGHDARIQISDDTAKSFRDLSFKMGLTPAQAKGLQDWNMTNQKNALAAHDTANETSKNETMTALKGEWGAKFDENLGKAATLVKTIGGQEALDWFDKGEGNNPVVIKMMANIANKMGEDALGDKGGSGVTLTPAQANAKISEIRNDKNHPFNNGEAFGHKEAVTYMQSLYAMAHPEPAQ